MFYGKDVHLPTDVALKGPTKTYRIINEEKTWLTHYQKLVFRTSQASLARRVQESM